ncbi:5-dehydro-2-deoxygluconokinase [Clostridium botulinum]|uniref:5-dehydro-2-deoxygluconokinase n=1 Tax=Clostridium botulinum (strain Eklund 17B / Type B) TaxID=935198 RepID=IOLC_CLOBB|nr:RecName: Full=5-dehydro-2-deoxygluconokinase; AltName: Full=2-deoxy-5-keto-D-gluconate kinase; Short=DKG kinase [Clostridium botulinum B str. Eklund 17B (NRP)]MBY6974876.1 5-dehydro-2-deoxygluconokinase [Clostridium botulinum]ACD24006.1 protein IolC [Clostridium botulinum B str. Eklund 17B (NRP)]MBY6999856.1 5-dehydro-2-deoxygluconokinase [Clostridium botulinum]MCR1274628.1 5-dehydro-2-deoxygluconokinase [Clostridium botulinum]NFD68429.1 5-dehydro-2-deoxygluconokinase [Clostridium botulinum
MGYIKFQKDRKFEIVPIGRVAIDFNPIDINRPLSESKTFKKYLGGSPANIAVGLSRLGKKVGFIGKVSKDQFGKFVVDYFDNEGIDTSQIKYAENGESLGLTFTEIASPTESSILMYRNGIADLELDVNEIDEEYIKNTKAIVISGTALAKSPSREAALKALELAKKNDTIVIFDVDYREYNWKNKDEIAIYYSIVGKQSDIVMGSREEFDLMESLIVKEKSTDEESAKRWLGFGNKIVVIKHGKEGSTAYTNDRKSYKIKPFPVKLLKSFGGGDAYASAFIYGILEEWDIMDALEFGSASAAMLVASHSCSEDMPTVKEINEFIKEKKEQYGEMIARG